MNGEEDAAGSGPENVSLVMKPGSRSMRFSAVSAVIAIVVFAALILLELSYVQGLEELNTSESDREANQVRRQGVDSSLLKYASMALPQGDIGSIHGVALPPTLTGFQSEVARYRSNNFSALTFNEFSIPAKVSFSDGNASSTVVFVYRKALNFTVYSLPQPYQFGGPVVGIIAYSGTNFTGVVDSDQVQELDISLPANSTSIHIDLPLFSSNPSSPNPPLCASLFPNGSVFVTNLSSSPNHCQSSSLGDFALVLQSSSSPSSPSPSLAPTLAPSPPSSSSSSSSSSSKSNSSRNARVVVAAVLITLAGLALLVALALIGMKLAGPVQRKIMSHFSKNDETLQISLVGASRAPSASTVRTKPTLEMDMAQFTPD